MPLALLEALACGCPAVGSDVGAIPDVLEGAAGTVVPVEDVEALTTALAAALSGEATLSREAARARGEQYSQQACYGAYADLLHRLAPHRA